MTLFNDDAMTPSAFDAHFRTRAGAHLAGLDEAGRGPLAGPVVAAAVILAAEGEYPGVTDSKKMTEKSREEAFMLLQEKAVAWAWAAVEPGEVDRINPLAASMLAMRLAVEKLSVAPGFLLVDGNCRPEIDIPLQTVVKGDFRSLSIGAASIMAKVTRDRIMLALHELYPQYGFDKHKGYGTRAHLKALAECGPSPCHRLSYRGVLRDAPKRAAERFDFHARG